MKLFDKTEFWKYAYSNFKDNTIRSALAEYIVASAVNVYTPPETGWEAYDILTNDGIKVEVKASGYVQAWEHNKHSTPTYDIEKKHDSHLNQQNGKKSRHADVYVFCLHNEKDKVKADPLQADQWVFYVVPTLIINEKLGDQKSVRLSTIENVLGVQAVGYGVLGDEIIRCKTLLNQVI